MYNGFDSKKSISKMQTIRGGRERTHHLAAIYVPKTTAIPRLGTRITSAVAPSV